MRVLIAVATLLVGAQMAIAAPVAKYVDSGSGPAKDDNAEDGGSSFFEDGNSLLHSYSVIGGAFHEGGDGELSGWKHDHSLAPKAYGFGYFERNGFVSGTIAAIAIVLAGSAAASGPKRVESWESGSYKYTKYT
ncbi:MAG: hypothetical protein EXR77_07005 [Myxococcales bacterium]|nr:hypothetical protein [Myxococcales bacterium]